MEKMVSELKRIVAFKDDTVAGDVVLVAGIDPQLLVYALVLDITRDPTKRDEWWALSLLFLTVPPQKTTWMLRTPQMTGMEIFTMDGAQRFLKALDTGTHPLPRPKQSPAPMKSGKPGLRRIK